MEGGVVRRGWQVACLTMAYIHSWDDRVLWVAILASRDDLVAISPVVERESRISSLFREWMRNGGETWRMPPLQCWEQAWVGWAALTLEASFLRFLGFLLRGPGTDPGLMG